MTESKGSVLLIEDGATYGRLASYLLRGLGYAVTLAGSAEEGLTLARTLLPDLILMDLNLPGMDGYAAVAAVRKDPGLRHIPTVAMTADVVEPATMEQGMAAGFSGFTEKPIYEDGFRYVVETYISRA